MVKKETDPKPLHHGESEVRADTYVGGTGEYLGKTDFTPAVLPLAGIVWDDVCELARGITGPNIFLFALTSRGGLTRGDLYRLKAITAKGKVVVEGNPFA